MKHFFAMVKSSGALIVCLLQKFEQGLPANSEKHCETYFLLYLTLVIQAVAKLSDTKFSTL